MVSEKAGQIGMPDINITPLSLRWQGQENGCHKVAVAQQWESQLLAMYDIYVNASQSSLTKLAILYMYLKYFAIRSHQLLGPFFKNI